MPASREMLTNATDRRQQHQQRKMNVAEVNVAQPHQVDKHDVFILFYYITIIIINTVRGM